ncbi:AMP-binding protein [Lacticaseibacillus zhaodongensis]|uniref:AMP-binding protein n=1 Tax=Lacticaseibacillus zhaodongensis TaxID=2668065 RepID=UPI0012D33912|nr:AMP-binding protein [Lacticaseibacillus zhaodongensis]
MGYLHTVLTAQLDQSSTKPLVKALARDTWYTGAELTAARNTLAAGLQAQGVQSGDIVLLAHGNSAELLVALLACWQLDAIAYTVNPKMPAAEFTEILQRHEYAAIVPGPENAAMLSDIYQQSGRDFSQTSVNILGQTQPLLSLQRTGRPSNPMFTAFQKRTASPLAVLMYTSGTTGAPKAVVLDQDQLLAAARDIAASQDLTAADRSLLILPLFHINAQVISLLSTLVSGGKLLIAPKFSAHQFWPQIAQEAITWVSAAPAIIAILNKTRPEIAPDVPSLRFVRSASAPLLPAVQNDFEGFFNIPIIQGYGMTECASQITLNPIGHTRVGSVGKSSGTAICILDENDKPLPAGETGEISLRGDHVITSYLDPAHQADFAHGWFHTGDVGYLDADGFLFIVGRKKELINRSGDKVSPSEVENVLIQHPAVSALAVIGLPDPIYGERVVAAVIPNAGYTADDQLSKQLQQYAADRLAAFKVPAQVIYVHELAAGPTGKIQHTRVRRAIMQQLAAKEEPKHANS